MSLLRSLLVTFFLAWLVTPAVLAQMPPTSDTTSTPIPGAGHNYLGGGVDTVNPGNGAVSIRIPVIVPPGRGLTLPFTFAYDSNGAAYLGQTPTFFGWLNSNSLISTGGWSNTLPIMSVGQANYTVPGTIPILNPSPQACLALVGYVFQDPVGNRHNLNLSVYGRTGANNGGDCSQSSYGWFAAGGEGSMSAVTTSPPVGAGRVNTTLTPVTVTDADGIAFSFPGGPIPSSVMPSTISDRNGNTITVHAPTGGGISYSLTDTLGRTVLSDSGLVGNPETVTVSGLSSPYTLTWTRLAPATFTTTFTNFGPGTCQAPTSHLANSVVSGISLPNGQAYSFSYDPTYGMVNRITYPTGGYVRYVWGMDSQSEFGGFQFQQGLPCTVRY